jgi:hypothetical protein
MRKGKKNSTDNVYEPSEICIVLLKSTPSSRCLAGRSQSKFDQRTPELRDNILEFYSGASSRRSTQTFDRQLCSHCLIS